MTDLEREALSEVQINHIRSDVLTCGTWTPFYVEKINQICDTAIRALPPREWVSAWAVRNEHGYLVGIWRNEEIAETVAAKGKDGEIVIEVKIPSDPPQADAGATKAEMADGTPQQLRTRPEQAADTDSPSSAAAPASPQPAGETERAIPACIRRTGCGLSGRCSEVGYCLAESMPPERPAEVEAGEDTAAQTQPEHGKGTPSEFASAVPHAGLPEEPIAPPDGWPMTPHLRAWTGYAFAIRQHAARLQGELAATHTKLTHAREAAVRSAQTVIAAERAGGGRAKELEELRKEAGFLWHALKDLSFDCDGVTQTQAPQRGTYNSTFAVCQQLTSKYQHSVHYQARTPEPAATQAALSAALAGGRKT